MLNVLLAHKVIIKLTRRKEGGIRGGEEGLEREKFRGRV
jgi:hypothetical protein